MFLAHSTRTTRIFKAWASSACGFKPEKRSIFVSWSKRSDMRAEPSTAPPQRVKRTVNGAVLFVTGFPFLSSPGTKLFRNAHSRAIFPNP